MTPVNNGAYSWALFKSCPFSPHTGINAETGLNSQTGMSGCSHKTNVAEPLNDVP